jgi:GNAT superfamily N-acetyltransferase
VSGSSSGITVRLLRNTDSIADLTSLLHRAYAPLAEAGLRFFATWQSEADTRARALAGECWIVEDGGAIVGTVTLRGPSPVERPESRVPIYSEPGIYAFGQLGVEPAAKGRGLGRLLMDTVERRTSELGGRALACDTAETASELIAMYTRRGFVPHGHVQWDDTNYRSVILVKWLGSRDASEPSRRP